MILQVEERKQTDPASYYSQQRSSGNDLQDSEVSQAMEGVLLDLLDVVLLEGSAQPTDRQNTGMRERRSSFVKSCI